MKKNYLIELLARKYQLNIEMLKIIIESIPANIFFKDKYCRYQIINRVCYKLIGRSKKCNIIGKTDLEIQEDTEFGEFYYDDKKIIETKKGSHYVSEMVFDGKKYYYEISKEPLIDIEGNLIGIIGIINDITELKKTQEKLRIMSITDKLTGVYNRAYFEQKMIDLSQSSYSSLSIIMCDTNSLKFLNDNFGHQRGDALLIETTSIFKDVIGDAGEIMRIGGDEFIIFCVNCLENKCKKLVKELKDKERRCQTLDIPISNSYGYTTLMEKDKDLKFAITVAEKMMYKEKSTIKEDYLKKLEILIHK